MKSGSDHEGISYLAAPVRQSRSSQLLSDEEHNPTNSCQLEQRLSAGNTARNSPDDMYSDTTDAAFSHMTFVEIDIASITPSGGVIYTCLICGNNPTTLYFSQGRTCV